MTDREAIETIKVAIAEVEWNYPMSYAVAFETAQDALRERMKRGDGCEYCNHTDVPKDWDASTKSFVVGDREYIPCDDYFYSYSRRISFCPMCGRSLAQQKKEEYSDADKELHDAG